MLSVGYPGSRTANAQDLLTSIKKRAGKRRIAVVHRLDRDTSGVMMYACSAEAKKTIMDGWQKIVTERIYRLVCARSPNAVPLEDEGTIKAPLAYNRHDVAFVPRAGDSKHLKDAEKAITHYRVLERGDVYDLVECSLETGRKNQIRAHMAYLGHPVIGDGVYGLKDITDEDNDDEREPTGPSPIGRLALHARTLAFVHPFTGEALRFELSESESFAKIVATKRHIPRKERITRKDGTVLKREIVEKYPRKEKIEDLTDLKPLARGSLTKQINQDGISRFIPAKQKPASPHTPKGVGKAPPRGHKTKSK